MRTLILMVVTWCMVQVAGFAEVPPQQSLTFAWEAPTNTAGPFTYRMYKVQDGATNLLWSTTNTTGTVSNLTPTAFRVFVTASNERGESDPSIPVVLPAFPNPPTKLKPVTSTMRVRLPATVEISQDLATWNEKWRWFRINDDQELVVVHMMRPNEPFAFMTVKPDPRPGLPR